MFGCADRRTARIRCSACKRFWTVFDFLDNCPLYFHYHAEGPAFSKAVFANRFALLVCSLAFVELAVKHRPIQWLNFVLNSIHVRRCTLISHFAWSDNTAVTARLEQKQNEAVVRQSCIHELFRQQLWDALTDISFLALQKRKQMNSYCVWSNKYNSDRIRVRYIRS